MAPQICTNRVAVISNMHISVKDIVILSSSYKAALYSMIAEICTSFYRLMKMRKERIYA